MKQAKFTAKEIGLLLSLWLMANLPIFYKVFLNGEGSAFYFLTCTLASLMLVFIFYSIRKWWLFIPLVLLLMLTSGTESFCIVVYKDFIRTGNILSIMTTNARESSNFGANNSGNLLYTVPCIIFAVAAIVMHILTNKSRKQTKIAGCSWICALITLGASCLNGDFHNPPYNAFEQLCGVAYYQGAKAIQMPKADKMTFGAKRNRTEGKEIYVMGIGESMRYDHTSFSGYKRNTTPLLAAEPNLVAYSNYMANATLTLFAVPTMISRATADDYYLSMPEKTIIDPYKTNGFKTFVISTGKLLANFPYFTKGNDGIFSVKNDSEVPALIDSLSNIYEKTFFIVQLKQCHSYYDNFTPDCDKFHPNLISDRSVKSDDLYMNAYDNATLYADKIMDQIIRTIDQPECKSAFVFASDHGEILSMHGHRRGNSMTPGEEEYHVPMFFWYSDSWAMSYAGKAENARRNKDKATGADNLFYTACDMADIILPQNYSKPEGSILSTQFKETERTLLLPDGKSILHIK